MTRHLRRVRPALVALALTLSLSGAVLAADLGEEAPELDVTEWVSGSAVDLAAGKDKVTHVVAFLSTFDPGSQKAFEQLAKLHEEHKAKGVVVLAVCDQTPEKVKEWLAEHPQPFPVAADPRRNTVAPYMKNKPGVPYVFIVGKPGTIYWDGNPTVGFEDVFARVVAGTYDAAHEKAVADAREELQKGLMKRQPKFFLGPLDSLLDLEPADTRALSIKLQVLQNHAEEGEKPDPAAFHAWCAGHLPKIAGKADALNMIAWELLTDGRFEWRKPDLGLEAAQQAVKACEGKKGGIVDTLARGWFEIGQVKKAVEVQRQALSVAENDEEKASLQKTLSYYETCLKLGEKAGGKGK